MGNKNKIVKPKGYEEIYLITSEPFDAAEDATFATLQELMYAGLAATSARMYGSVLNRWREACAADNIGPISGITMDRVKAFMFADYKDAKVSESTAVLRRAALLAWLHQFIGWLDLSKTSNTQLSVAEQMQMVNKAKMWEYVRNKISEIKIREENVSWNPRQKIVIRAHEFEEIMKMEAVKNPARLIDERNILMLLVMYVTGLRRAEIVKLTWQNFVFPTRNGNATIQFRRAKTGRASTVALFDKYGLVERFLSYKAKIVPYSDYAFPPFTKSDVPKRNSKPMDVATVNLIYDKLSYLIGIKLHPHATRRSMATGALDAGVPVHQVAKQGGWEDPKTMLKHYAISDSPELFDPKDWPGISSNDFNK